MNLHAFKLYRRPVRTRPKSASRRTPPRAPRISNLSLLSVNYNCRGSRAEYILDAPGGFPNGIQVLRPFGGKHPESGMRGLLERWELVFEAGRQRRRNVRDLREPQPSVMNEALSTLSFRAATQYSMEGPLIRACLLKLQGGSSYAGAEHVPHHCRKSPGSVHSISIAAANQSLPMPVRISQQWVQPVPPRGSGGRATSSRQRIRARISATVIVLQ